MDITKITQMQEVKNSEPEINSGDGLNGYDRFLWTIAKRKERLPRDPNHFFYTLQDIESCFWAFTGTNLTVQQILYRLVSLTTDYERNSLALRLPYNVYNMV